MKSARHRTRRYLVVLGVALWVGCGGSRLSVRPVDVPLPGACGPGVHAVLVVAARTGEPLTDVHVRLYREQTEPWEDIAPFVTATKTDARGLASLPWKEDYAGCHWVFDKAGYAPESEFGASWHRIGLSPGRTVRGRLQDESRRYARDVELQYFLGCPHSPAVRRAVTDRLGGFVIHDVDPQSGTLWTQAEGLAAELWQPSLEPRPEAVYERIVAERSETVRGRAVRPDGTPAAGAVDYSEQTPRGPRTRAGEDGSFVLEGVALKAPVELHPPGVKAEMRRTEKERGAIGILRAKPHVLRITPPGDPADWTFRIGDGDEVEPDGDGVAVLETQWRGELLLTATHAEYGTTDLVVHLEGAASELGPEAFPRPGALFVAGRPSGVDVEVWAPNGWEQIAMGEPVPFTRVIDFRLQDGATVRLSREDHLPSVHVLRGDPPFEVALPDGALDLRRRGGGAFAVVVRGHLFESDEGVLRLRGLPPGPLTFLAGAGGRTLEVRVDVPAEGVRRLTLALP